MSDLTGRTQNDTFRDLIHFENSNLGFDATLRVIESGNGIGSTLSLSTIGATIAGTLGVAGVASFDLVPLVSGSPVWYPGNDGAGSGLDADLLDGLQAAAFAQAGNPLTITGLWQFQTGPQFAALNDTELARFMDTTNDIQMQVRFDTNLDFSLVPGTSSVFDETKRFYYDSTAETWAANTGLNLTEIDAAIFIEGSGGPIRMLTTIGTAGTGALLGGSDNDTALQSSTGEIFVIGADPGDFSAGIRFLAGDETTTNGQIGYFDGDFDALVIRDDHASEEGIFIESVLGGLTIDVEGPVEFSTNGLDGMSLFTGGVLSLDSDDDIDITAASPGTLTLDGGQVVLNNDGSPVFATQDETLATTTSGAQILDGSSNFQDVGFNAMPNTNQGAAFTLGVNNAGGKQRYTGAGSQAATLADEANIPDDATWVIVNAGTGDLDITITTLTWYDGSGTIQTGNRVLAIAGVATITKRIDGQYEIWGAGLT